MTPEVVADQIRIVFDPIAAGALAAMIVLFAAMGYASLRFLRKQPDFPEKPQMIWGAKWFWALTAGLIIVKYLVGYLGAVLTGYSFTFMFAGLIVFLWAFFLLVFVLPHQTSGAAVCVVPLRAWMDRKPVDLPAWLDRQRRTRQSTCFKVGMLASALLLTVFFGCLMAEVYPREREMTPLWEYMEPGLTHTRQHAPVASAVREQLDGDSVLKVVAGTRLFLHELAVWIRVRQETTPEQATALLEQAKQALRAQDRPERWEIRVYTRDKAILATGEYLPGPDQP